MYVHITTTTYNGVHGCNLVDERMGYTGVDKFTYKSFDGEV
jgi:hypothetical protein